MVAQLETCQTIMPAEVEDTNKNLEIYKKKVQTFK
jgi:hypothetical protein